VRNHKTVLRRPLVGLLTLAALAGCGDRGIDGLRLEGRARISAVYDLAVHESYVYALERNMLRVLSARDLAAVQEGDSLAFDIPRARLAHRHPFLYLTGFGGPLGLIDVSQPEHPEWVGEWEEVTGAWNDGFEIVGDVGYLVTPSAVDGSNAAFLDVLDLTPTPERPVVLARIDLGLETRYLAGGLAEWDGRVFALSRNRVAVVDVGDPTSPFVERVLELPAGRRYWDLAVRNDTLYMLAALPAGGLAVFDASRGTRPRLLGEVLDPRLQNASDLQIDGTAVHATFKGAVDVVTFDVSNAAQPTIAFTHTIPDLWAAGLGFTVAGDRLFASGDGGPSAFFDLGADRIPRLLGHWRYDGGITSTVAVDGDRVLVGNLGGGLFVFDAVDREAPRRVLRYTTAQIDDVENFQWNTVVVGRGNKAYAAYETLLGEHLEIDADGQVRLLGRHRTRGLVRAAAMTGDHAYLGFQAAAPGRIPIVYDPASVSGAGGVEIVELSDDGIPRTVGVANLERGVTDIFVSADLAFAAHGDGGLSVLDVGDPRRPVVVGGLPGPGLDDSYPVRGGRLALSPRLDRLYLTHGGGSTDDDPYHGTGSLRIVDVSDPSNPEVLGTLSVAREDAAELLVGAEGNYAVLYAGDLIVVDATDPAAPVIVDRTLFPAGNEWSDYIDLAIDHDHVYVTAHETGLWIYRFVR